MLPSELKLASLNHCYVQLPELFVSKEPNLRAGSIVSLKSVQNDTELMVMWNGNLSPGSYAQLDFCFAQANNLKDELVILCSPERIASKECTLCRVELINSEDYTILSQHSEANILDSCKFVTIGLVIPIYLSQNVKVLVKVQHIEPGTEFGLLTKWTEMQFNHSLDKLPEVKTEETDEDKTPSGNLVPLVSYNLGICCTPVLHGGSLLVYGERGSGKTHFLQEILNHYKNVHGLLFNCQQLRGKRPENVKKKLAELLAEALDRQPSIVALDDVDSLLAVDPKHEDEKGHDAIYRKRLVDAFIHLLKQIERSEHGKGRRVSLIAASRTLESLDPEISEPKGRRYFQEMIKLGPPNLEKRCLILKRIVAEQKQVKCDLHDAQFESIANRCNSFMPSDLRRLVERSIISACSRSMMEFNSEPVTLLETDLLDAIEGYVPYNLRGASLKPKSKRTFAQVGGMKSIKDKLMRIILLQIKYPRLYKRCPMKAQSSILLYGPPGCGKTLLGEALTNEDCINSICVRGPELLSKYIGASEAAVRDLFRRAELARPCVIFFDEFESLVAKRGSDSTGVTDRVVNQFLTLMDGVEKLSSDVFLVAASSRPDIIDPAILRPGRLDLHIYCPPPETGDRLDILRVLSKDMDIEDGKDDILAKWAEKLEKFTGADIQSLLCSAQLKALHEIIGPTDFGSTSKAPICGNDKASAGHQVRDFKLTVREKHLQQSYEEMRLEVASKFLQLTSKYPKVIGQNAGLAASRATLA